MGLYGDAYLDTKDFTSVSQASKYFKEMLVKHRLSRYNELQERGKFGVIEKYCVSKLINSKRLFTRKKNQGS